MKKPRQQPLISTVGERGDAYCSIDDELVGHAEAKFPKWPIDQIHGAGVLVEEAGETMQAAINHVYQGESDERIEEEAIQTAAMAVRLIIWLRSRRRKEKMNHEIRKKKPVKR